MHFLSEAFGNQPHLLYILNSITPSLSLPLLLLIQLILCLSDLFSLANRISGHFEENYLHPSKSSCFSSYLLHHYWILSAKFPIP